MIYTLISILLMYANYTPVKTSVNEIAYCKLKWDYFSSKQPTDNTVAETVTAIGYSYDGDKKVDVFCTFDKNESFVSKNGRTQYILNHEQRHFDITYYFTLKLVKQINEQKQLSDKVIEALYDNILVEKDKMQSQYDSETRNSENKQEQALWNAKIDKFLK